LAFSYFKESPKYKRKNAEEIYLGKKKRRFKELHIGTRPSILVSFEFSEGHLGSGIDLQENIEYSKDDTERKVN